ncbi:MAG: NAD-dependent epimerase/dehydratase family protein, partial [Planctomycetota bacterium]
MPESKLIFGCGYVGWRVAERWLKDGCHVYVATRSPHRAEELQRGGYAPIVADVTQPNTLDRLPPVDTTLFAVGHDRSAKADIYQVYAEGMANVLDSAPHSLGRFIYVSTTGVYGPAGGNWVDETTPTNPQRDGGKASLAAELALSRRPAGAGSAVLRLAGIYGAGRVPYLEKLRRGDPIPAPVEGWLNLIHVDDAAAAILAADDYLADRSEGGPWVFCVSDGAPVRRGDYYREVARRLGGPQPRFTAPPADSPAVLESKIEEIVVTSRKRAE